MSDCKHSWSEDYVCEHCGKAWYASAPQWLLELDSVKVGPWRVLLALWSFVRGRDGRAGIVWAGNAKLRKRCGNVSESVLCRHLAELKRLGWVALRQGARREFCLAWARPFHESERTLPAQAKKTTPRNLASPTSQPCESYIARMRVLHRKDATHNYYEHEQETGEERAGARGTRTVTFVSPAPLRACPEDQPAMPSKPEQTSLPIPLGSPQPTPDPVSTDPPDPVMDLFEELTRAKIAAKRKVGLRAAGPRTLSKQGRSLMGARLREHGPEDCRKVIAVCAAECVAQGPDGKSWAFFDAVTPWRPDNFSRKLEQWRPDHGHVLLGVAREDRRTCKLSSPDGRDFDHTKLREQNIAAAGNDPPRGRYGDF